MNLTTNFLRVKTVTNEPGFRTTRHQQSGVALRLPPHSKTALLWSAPAERSDDGALGCGVVAGTPLVGLIRSMIKSKSSRSNSTHL